MSAGAINVPPYMRDCETILVFFFFNDTATTEIYTLSLHDALPIYWTQAWTSQDTRAAFRSWNEYVRKRRSGIVAKRPIADILIGAFARRFDGLLTRNAKQFSRLFPELTLVEPKRR